MLYLSFSVWLISFNMMISRSNRVGAHDIILFFSYGWVIFQWLLATPWTTAYQAPLSMGFSRQEYWSEVPLPSLVYFIYIYTHTHTHTHTHIYICTPLHHNLFLHLFKPFKYLNPFLWFLKITYTFSEYALGEIDLDQENLRKLSSPRLEKKVLNLFRICVLNASYLYIIF